MQVIRIVRLLVNNRFNGLEKAKACRKWKRKTEKREKSEFTLNMNGYGEHRRGRNSTLHQSEEKKRTFSSVFYRFVIVFSLFHSTLKSFLISKSFFLSLFFYFSIFWFSHSLCVCSHIVDVFHFSISFHRPCIVIDLCKKNNDLELQQFEKWRKEKDENHKTSIDLNWNRNDFFVLIFHFFFFCNAKLSISFFSFSRIRKSNFRWFRRNILWPCRPSSRLSLNCTFDRFFSVLENSKTWISSFVFFFLHSNLICRKLSPFIAWLQ